MSLRKKIKPVLVLILAFLFLLSAGISGILALATLWGVLLASSSMGILQLIGLIAAAVIDGLIGWVLLA